VSSHARALHPVIGCFSFSFVGGLSFSSPSIPPLSAPLVFRLGDPCRVVSAQTPAGLATPFLFCFNCGVVVHMPPHPAPMRALFERYTALKRRALVQESAYPPPPPQIPLEFACFFWCPLPLFNASAYKRVQEEEFFKLIRSPLLFPKYTLIFPRLSRSPTTYEIKR